MEANTTVESTSLGWIPTDLYQVITNHFIKFFHQATIPWRQGTSIPFHGFARNYYSGHVYRGINWLLLNLLDPKTNPHYLTWGQVQHMSGSVLKGSHARYVYYFNTYHRDDQGNYITVVRAQQLEQQGAEVQRISYLKQHLVYRVDQTTDIEYQEAKLMSFGAPEQLLECMEEKPEIVRHDGSEAHYDPEEDIIILPSHEAEHETAYLLFVQLIHWTGHKKRLNRHAIAKSVLDGAYDIEEQFIADIGASMLCRMFNVPLDWNLEVGEEDTINFWIQALEEDKYFIFRVASKAQAAVEYILQH